MKEEALALIEDVVDPALKLNRLREYIQAFVLRSLHESEAFHSLSFVGGTALRFLHNLPRFSEDLDFSVEDDRYYDPLKWLKKIERDLKLAGFHIGMRWNDHQTVHVGWIRLTRILSEAKLAAIPEQKLAVKLEIDTQPPEGAVLQRQLLNRHMIFAIRHHDLPSLMAGNIYELLTRRYLKGRDWYDILWYRSRRPPVEPNLVLLKNALAQTKSVKPFEASSWPTILLRRINKLKIEALARDVRPFLERPQESGLLTYENLKSIFPP
jgi:hypothetical protein